MNESILLKRFLICCAVKNGSDDVHYGPTKAWALKKALLSKLCLISRGLVLSIWKHYKEQIIPVDTFMDNTAM